MRQLHRSVEEKALMFDLMVDNTINEYNNRPPVEKKYHSRAEKIGYIWLTEIESNGFITTKGILDQ